MIYSKIKNPQTNRWVSIYSNIGKRIIQQYMDMVGGSKPQESYKSNIVRALHHARHQNVISESEFNTFIKNINIDGNVYHLRSIHEYLVYLKNKKIKWNENTEVFIVDPYEMELESTYLGKEDMANTYSKVCSKGDFSTLCSTLDYPCLVSSDEESTTSDVSEVSNDSVDSKCFDRDGDNWVVTTK